MSTPENTMLGRAMSETISLNGLTEAQARARRAKGQGNTAPPRSGRTYWDIIRENVFTFINISILGLSAVLFLLGDPLSAFLAGWAIAFNVIVSMIQEIRAKQKLDQLQLLVAPKATVIREGVSKQVAPEVLVVGDVLQIRPGDQIVLDGSVIDGKFSADESALTGESDLIPKTLGSPVYSGSFCVSGTARYVADKVGASSLTNQMTAGARVYRRTLTPLQTNVASIVRVIVAIVYFLEVVFIINALVRQSDLTVAISNFIIVMGLVPAGLFLATVVAYSLAAVRVGDKGALVQQANAVESLSYVNVLCTDKTGTLTTNRLKLQAVHALDGNASDFRRVLGAMTHATASPNKTSEAIAAAIPANALSAEKIALVNEIPFSSARKWSATAFDAENLRGVFALGAPEFLRPYLGEAGQADAAVWQTIQAQANEWTAQGLRVLLIASHPDAHALQDDGDASRLPTPMQPLGLVSLSDELRPDARETLQAFIRIGVTPKIISGDNPETVAALARQAGLPEDLQIVSGLDLEQMDDGTFDETAVKTTVFGRITPQQKQRLVKSLRAQGYYVAMTGDGVNDVLSLKEANLSIAMESGSQATRNVADIVLLKDQFAALPFALTEGQRIISGMEDIIKLNVAYSAIVGVVIITSVMVALFPISLQQASLANFFAVGIPGVLIALWARPGARQVNRNARIFHFIMPPIAVTSILSLLVLYGVLWVRLYMEGAFAVGASLEDLSAGVTAQLPYAQTAVVTFLTFTLLMLVIFVKPPFQFLAVISPLSQDKRFALLAVGLMLVYLVILALPLGRTVYGLELLTPATLVVLGIALVVWVVLVVTMWRKHSVEKFLGLETVTAQADAVRG
jgi:cation-transporting ATPase E